MDNGKGEPVDRVHRKIGEGKRETAPPNSRPETPSTSSRLGLKSGRAAPHRRHTQTYISKSACFDIPLRNERGEPAPCTISTEGLGKSVGTLVRKGLSFHVEQSADQLTAVAP
ncbi:hypothetical protein, unlikely [Trypanosoma brucei gambiense DAL972]|uniref:Uncharacterized protein n=1 Tax=Trypanosoma brucei gambiense (strain MHOM/CI/86/DAL972) TaxID=679716 RepID=C9ZVS7_TRYB9|nr:hypothetical protein, unlikely [Trypanosoma brucei gambiense DAL972]CBH13515.1 hypothetical protein, unlikely [Trypanosoma brucei gambiense DAL972]|eukprot:XP_011775792.1 hypothetical protein, unlikely [Trypanosoma brucei gambiense DAL972]